MEELTGKEAVVQAAGRLLDFIKSIQVHARFGSEDQAMLTYDMAFAGANRGLPRGRLDDVLKDGLIERNELFFDASPFKKN